MYSMCIWLIGVGKSMLDTSFCCDSVAKIYPGSWSLRPTAMDTDDMLQMLFMNFQILWNI